MNKKLLNDVINYRENWYSCDEILSPTEEKILEVAIEMTLKEDKKLFNDFIEKLKKPIQAELKEAEKHETSISITVKLLFNQILKHIDNLKKEYFGETKGEKLI